jgi:hypothetical protein
MGFRAFAAAVALFTPAPTQKDCTISNDLKGIFSLEKTLFLESQNSTWVGGNQ